MEYLEALHPHTPMRPASSLDAAKQQALIRFADLYLAAAMFPLFRALRGAVGPEGVAEAINGVKTQLQALEALLPLRPQRPGLLDLADAALLPIIWYARVLMRHFDHGADCLAPTPQVEQWWSETSQVPAAATVLGEMEVGLRAALPMLFND